MYAIVDIAGQQFKVEKQQKLFVHRLDSETGAEVSFEKVLLIDNDGEVTVGTPEIKDAAVSAKVIDHVKGDKVLVFKKKRRKGYRKLNGHRQLFTQIEITDIKEKAVKKAEAKPAAEKKTAAPKTAAAKKPAAAKSTAAKKPAATKSSSEKPATKSTTAAKPAAKSTKSGSKPAAKKPAAGEKKSDSSKPADKK